MPWCAAGDIPGAGATERSVARGMIDAVAAGPAALERDRLIMADLVEHHPDVAHRTCRPGHLTGSAAVLDAAGEHTLLLLHAKLGRWLQPGGHADGETALSAVALREATEETGLEGLRIDPVPIDLDIHLVDPPAEDAHLHLDVRFVVIAGVDTVVRPNEESVGHRWVPVTDVDTTDVDPGLRRMVRAARRRIGAAR